MKYVLLLLLVILPTSIFAQEERSETESSCKTEEACMVPYFRLSDEGQIPFKHKGRMLEPGDEPYRKFQRAVQRFPSVLDCLQEAEHESDTPNLNLVDWKNIKNAAEFEVCLFRIHTSIRDIEVSKNWFEEQGFILGVSGELPYHLTRLYGDTAPGYKFIVEWSNKTNGLPYGSNPIHNWWNRRLTPSMNVSVSFSSEDEILQIYIIFNSWFQL